MEVNKKYLESVLIQKCFISPGQAKKVVDTVFDEITRILVAGDELSIVGFGKFFTKLHKGRIGINPLNIKEKIVQPPVLLAKFKTGYALKKALKQK